MLRYVIHVIKQGQSGKLLRMAWVRLLNCGCTDAPRQNQTAETKQTRRRGGIEDESGGRRQRGEEGGGEVRTGTKKEKRRVKKRRREIRGVRNGRGKGGEGVRQRKEGREKKGRGGGARNSEGRERG